MAYVRPSRQDYLREYTRSFPEYTKDSVTRAVKAILRTEPMPNYVLMLRYLAPVIYGGKGYGVYKATQVTRRRGSRGRLARLSK